SLCVLLHDVHLPSFPTRRSSDLPDIEINQTESGLKNTKNLTTRADKVIRHIFQWGPYPEADYGPDIDWSADPAGDIEWVASVYRDRKSTRLNSSHVKISYAVFCL